MNFGGRANSDTVSTTSASTDHQLLRAWLGGDSRALAKLWVKYQADVDAVAYRHSWHPRDRADCSCEAMARTIENLPRFRGDAAVRTWLTRLVVNSCHDYGRGRFGVCDLARGNLSAADDSVWQPRVYRDLSFAVMVKSLLYQLPPVQREAIFVMDVAGFTTAEFAEWSGESEGTLKARRARAKKFLRQNLNGVQHVQTTQAALVSVLS